ncbi:MAG: putative drug exporter of the superfamily [Thermoleophilaceae bacterium]|nr:putative drug exporter of the superfamily [Thermoleophilaceae bacterium]
MNAIARLGVRYPKAVVAGWIAAVLVLGVLGINVESKLRGSDLVIPGTEIARWSDARAGHYGAEATVILTGTAAELDRQGPVLAKRLSDRPHVGVLSPWSGGDLAEALRPEPGRAVFVLDLVQEPGQGVDDVIEPVRDMLGEEVRPPLHWYYTGLGPLGQAINKEAVSSVASAEQIAFPALIVVLLLVFRSVVAAMIPLFIALCSVRAACGVIALLTNWVPLDAVTLSLASLIGLALGVDYSLLIVTRFREQLDSGTSVRHSASLAAQTAGRTAVFAAVVLTAIMSVSLLLSPGTILLSASVGAITVTAIAAVGGAIVTPAILSLLGHRVNRLRIGPTRTQRSGPGRIEVIVGRLTRRPGFAAAAVLLLLLLAASPVLGLDAIPPDPRQLPPGSDGFKSYDQVRQSGLGPSLDISVKAPEGSLTTPARLKALRTFEQSLADVDYVKLAVGPGSLAQAAELPGGGGKGAGVEDSQKQVSKLTDGLARAADGVGKLRGGVIRAAGGSRRLEQGIANAEQGSGRLSQGGHRASSGADRIAQATDAAKKDLDPLRHKLTRARNGTRRLADGASRAQHGSVRLARGAGRLHDGLAGKLGPGVSRLADGLGGGGKDLGRLTEPAGVIEQQLKNAIDDLNNMLIGKTDPRYGKALRATYTALAATTGKDPRDGSRVNARYDGLVASLKKGKKLLGRGADGAARLESGSNRAAHGAHRLAHGSERLAGGLKRIEHGNRRIHSELQHYLALLNRSRPEISRLVEGVDSLAAGLGRLSAGTDELNAGLGRARGGLGTLSSKLAQGGRRSRPLQTGLEKISDRAGGLSDISRKSPGFVDSGYVGLAALAGARPRDRESAGFLIDLANGGADGRIVVVPDVPTNDPRTNEVVDTITADAAAFSKESHISTAVGGAAPELVVYDRVTTGRLPLLIGAIALVTYLLLVPILRSLLLPLLAVGLNVLTVAVGFGALCALFVGEHPLLGGAGALDVVTVAAVFSITFALSIDYQVFLLTRMREEYVRTQSGELAIEFGIRRTAAVVTGAAAIMMAVFFAFGLSDFVIIREFGIGLAVAVFIDATLVRLVLLPSLMKLFGFSTWWLPPWLDERLPIFDVEGSHAQAEHQALTRIMGRLRSSPGRAARV